MAADKGQFLVDYLEKYFDELTAAEFYRGIFPKGELATHEEKQVKGKYNAIAVELFPKDEENKVNVKRYVLTDDLEYLEELEKKDNFIIISPISYAGRKRTAENARFIYAMAIDLDGMTKEQNIIDLFHQIKHEVIPKPTYVVFSGNGLHLYYKFEKPIPCFRNIVEQLAKLKQAITKRVWNGYITSLSKKPQIQSLFQGFRMVGGRTKAGNRVRAFLTGEEVSIEYLNGFCIKEENKVKEFVYKSNLTLKQAQEKYPEWYDKRIINKQKRGTWTCKKDLYNWWLRRLKEEISEGHRYYGIMCLAIYAIKCGVSREELEQDAFSLLDKMEELTENDDNHFTEQDILAALELYNDSYITFPIDSIVELTAIPIQKNKRNYRKQAAHIEYMNTIREFKKKMGEPMAIGRPKGSGSKENIIIEWQRKNPNGTKAECIKETGISKPTVYKYWKNEQENKEK